MHIRQFPVGPFQMNAYIIHDTKSKECILVDPGDEIEKLDKYVRESGLKPQAIFNTHGHIDHIRFASIAQKKHAIPFYLCKEDLPLLENLKRQGAMYGIETAEPPAVTNFLNEGEIYSVGSHSFSVMYTPGHSPGSMCFLFDKDVIVGDVLFYDSIGRTDLYMGSYEVLLDSIKTKLLPLADDINVYSGHGPATTIGRERIKNPFLAGL
jgi:glyoxylase-like metal-dependent hydrolase (beta-lactamase superfamily II)